MNTNSLDDIIISNEKGVFLMADLIKQLKDRLTKKIPANVVIYSYLFGSYARNTANEESDVDICFIYDESKISEMDINLTVDDIADDLIDKYGVIINILCFRNSYYDEYKDSSVLFCNIREEGIAC